MEHDSSFFFLQVLLLEWCALLLLVWWRVGRVCVCLCLVGGSRIVGLSVRCVRVCVCVGLVSVGDVIVCWWCECGVLRVLGDVDAANWRNVECDVGASLVLILVLVVCRMLFVVVGRVVLFRGIVIVVVAESFLWVV